MCKVIYPNWRTFSEYKRVPYETVLSRRGEFIKKKNRERERERERERDRERVHWCIVVI
jgi:hypothetical protein